MSLVSARTIVSDLEFKRRMESPEFAQAIDEYIKNRDVISIKDWTGRELFKGSAQDPQVNVVLDANRCTSKVCNDSCQLCDGSGYSGDFEVNWVNENDKRNVYEFINY